MIKAITTAIRMIIKKYFSTNLKILFITLIFVKSINKCLYLKDKTQKHIKKKKKNSLTALNLNIFKNNILP